MLERGKHPSESQPKLTRIQTTHPDKTVALAKSSIQTKGCSFQNKQSNSSNATIHLTFDKKFTIVFLV